MKGKSIAEALIVFIALQALIIIPKGIRNLIRWENSALGGSYLTGALLIALALFMVIMKQYEFKSMGLSLENWQISLGYGLRGYLFFILPQIAIFLFLVWGLDYKDFMATAIVLGLLVLLMTLLMNRRSDIHRIRSSRFILIALLLVFPFVMSFTFDRFSTRLLLEFIWNTFVGGFAEEFFYRGFIQSSINLEFGRNWKLGKTNYGPGLFIASLLYGLSRGLRTWRPGSGRYSISWSWTLFAFTIGIFYGRCHRLRVSKRLD
jgi:membrane protease YdiL (CAAX protease family)